MGNCQRSKQDSRGLVVCPRWLSSRLDSVGARRICSSRDGYRGVHSAGRGTNDSVGRTMTMIRLLGCLVLGSLLTTKVDSRLMVGPVTLIHGQSRVAVL